LGRSSWLQLVARFTVRPRDGDVWFGPAYELPRWWRGASVVTIHDLAFMLIPGQHVDRARAARLAAAVRRSSRQAAAILCGSEETRTRIVDRLGVDPAKVEVTRYGVKQLFFDAAGAQNAEPPAGVPPYVLFVGTFQPRKGLDILHAALRSVNGSGSTRLRLVLAGRAGWKADDVVAGLAADPAVEFVDRPSDDRLAALYRGALAVVYPSVMEGFGLPVAEAKAMGTPVVASELGCIREFAEEVPLYVPPGDERALAGRLGELLDGAQLGERTAAGRRLASGLRWEDTAEKTARVVESVAGWPASG
jgi:glycosyltransferase involved in cell wall biosynthesis